MLGAIVKILITLAVLTGIVYVWDPSIIERGLWACRRPITYSLGSFDERFGITQEDFRSALAQAEDMWEKEARIELFSHVPEGGRVRVNLVYDYRQETTNTLQELEEEVEESEAAYNNYKSRYEELALEYEQEAEGYEESVQTFNDRSDAYEARVAAWNRGNRRSEAEFESLENERRALERELNELREKEEELNNLVREINSLVGTLNRLAERLNLNVSRYNTVGASRGETFTGGVYYSSAGEQGIDIYEFKDRERLVRVLAHELGHALGLEHVEDPQAIMYYLNEGENGDLTEDDIRALKVQCRLD